MVLSGSLAGRAPRIRPNGGTRAEAQAMQADIVYLAIGLGSFVLFAGMLVLLDERVLDRRR
jgi:hypothetical protein